jgi:PadR family transcriptional regulator PadR
VAKQRHNLLQGTLDLLILRALVSGEKHGLAISRRIEQMTNETFQVKPGSLFPALHRLEKAGWLLSKWGESETNRRAKYYKITKSGDAQLTVETEQWERISRAMANALRSA